MRKPYPPPTKQTSSEYDIEHTITGLHVIGAALWLGGLATLLANQSNANPTIVKRTALVSITGLAAATKYGDPPRG